LKRHVTSAVSRRLPLQTDRKPELSWAEARVLTAVMNGKQTSEIAFEIGTTEPAVKDYLKAILQKVRGHS
jgi:DNA-binding NarL/FixJ family response regulator